jgi:hypothetical protein
MPCYSITDSALCTDVISAFMQYKLTTDPDAWVSRSEVI